LQVHTRLAEATNAAREPVPESDTLTLELVCFNPYGLGKAEGSAKYTATACSTAVKVMHGAFAPLILESGEDMINLVVHSKDGNANTKDGFPYANSNFSGFRLAVLRQRGTLVCAATVRVFGTSFAELPFVATREGQRGMGFCRALLSALTAKLRDWGVQWLLLPSVPETRQLWTRHFGFVSMSSAEVDAVADRIVMPAEENVSMLKLDLSVHLPPPKATAPAGKSAPKSVGGAAGSSCTRSCSGAVPRVGRGTGTFSSLAAAVPAVPAAPAAPAGKRSPGGALGEEALGHTLADVLLSTMYDVDDERRSAQAEKHALLLQVQEQQREIQELRAQLKAAVAHAAGQPAEAGVADAPASGCDADVDMDAALAVLHALTDAHASSPKSPRSVLPDIVMASPAPPDTAVVASPEPEAAEPPQQSPTAPAALATAAPAAKLALPPLPPRCITDEAARAEAVDFAAQVLRRMPPGSTTWMADGMGAQLVMGEPLSWQGQEVEPMFDMQLVTEERLEHMTECL
jgi:N-acetylglutamate synthase-like GNAT family acetyltransferase